MKKILVILLFFCSFRFFAQCGEERWDVKTLTDKDTNLINWNAAPTTIVEQSDMEPITKKKTLPRQENECQVYYIDAFIAGYKIEADGDFHIVISDGEGHTMIAEIPSPECPEVQNCSQYKKISVVRQYFEDNFNPKKKYKAIKSTTKYRITGVGFSDFIHGQTGVAPSGRELHPVLSIKPLE